MDINKLLSEMTNEQAYELVKKAEIHAGRPCRMMTGPRRRAGGRRPRRPASSVGTSPVRHMKRNEVVAILGRLGLLK